MRGIDALESYHSLKAEREKRNVPTGEIVYRPKELGPAEFNSYRITDELKTALLKKDLAPTESQMRAAYDSFPVEIFLTKKVKAAKVKLYPDYDGVYLSKLGG